MTTDTTGIENNRQLQSCFEAAKACPLYAEFYEQFHRFQDAPALSKHELIPLLKKNFHLRRETKGLYLVRSGGSTQTPLIFPVDIAENHHQRQALANALTGAHMFSPRTVALNLFGYADMYRSASIMDDVLEKCEATTLPMSAHATYEAMRDIALHFHPDFVMGTPSKLLLFARFLEERGETLSIANLLYAGEFLRPSAQSLFSRIFQSNRFWSLYGSAETGIWAWCDVTQHPSLFRVIDGMVLEILEPDPNGYGLIAVTNTFRKRFPVFRYLVGDIGRWVTLDGIRYLELKSRESKSFVLCETHYDLDILQALTGAAEAFQVQLSTGADRLDAINVLLVQQVPALEKQQFIATKTAQLRDIMSYNPRFMQASVKLVHSKELFTDPATSKTPALVDWRR